MRTLQFEIRHPEDTALQQLNQEKVVSLLFKNLNQSGFDLSLPAYSTNTFVVALKEKQLPIEVQCQEQANGTLVCSIQPHPLEEELDWFDRIEAQSMVKQLASAVENILTEQEQIQNIEWKHDQS